MSIGEVFIKTHTRADGTYVDMKAKKIAEAYEKNLEEKMSQIEVDSCETSDGTSRRPELSANQLNEIFLEVQ